MTVVRLSHGRSAALPDALDAHLGGPGALLVSLSRRGYLYALKAVNEQFPGGWFGGSLPRRGFWGHHDPGPELLPWLVRQASQS